MMFKLYSICIKFATPRNDMTTLQDKYNRTPEQIRLHYETEKRLAQRLRQSTKTERQHLYSEVYDELYRTITFEPLVERSKNAEAQAWVANYRMDLLRPFLSPEKTYGEVGPGDCCVALAVQPLVKKVYAIDVSAEISKSVTFPENFELVLFDGCNIPLPDNSLDVAYSNQVIEHLHPDDAADQIKSIYQKVAPGGYFICITPNRLSGPHDISQYFDEVATCFHLKEYTTTELYHVLRDAGFQRVWLYKSRKTQNIKIPLNGVTLPIISLLESVTDLLPFALKRKVASLPLLFRSITLVSQKR